MYLTYMIDMMQSHLYTFSFSMSFAKQTSTSLNVTKSSEKQDKALKIQSLSQYASSANVTKEEPFIKAGKAYYISLQNGLCKTQSLSPDVDLLQGPAQFLFSPVFSPSLIHLQIKRKTELVGKSLFSRCALANMRQLTFLGSLRW